MKTKECFSKIILILLSLFLFSAFSIDAKELADDEKKKLERQNKDFDSLVVTARKREESADKVPAGMSVFSDIVLDDASIEDIEDLTKFSPNVYMKKGSAENTLVFRGISSFDTTIHSPAGLYIDDINLPLNYMQNPVLFDIERVEVLRGPQGTLYGRNSESGVINIVTRQPGNEFHLKAYGEYRCYDGANDGTPGYKAGTSINGPVKKDRLFFGLAGEVETSDGFIKNIHTNSEKDGEIESRSGRASFRWLPLDNLDISFITDVQNIERGSGNKRYIEGVNKTGRHEIAYNEDGFTDMEGDGQTLRLKYSGNLFNLLSVSGLRNYKSHMVRDADCSPAKRGLNDLTYDNSIMSQELRFFSPDAGKFEWLAGVYCFREENDIEIELQGVGETRNTDLEYNGYAVFGELTYNIFEKFHLTGGLRYDHMDFEGEQDLIRKDGRKSFEKSFDQTEVLPKISASYDISEDFMSYISVAKGFLAGGYNTAFAENKETFTYDPEYTWNYEAGIKSSLLNGRLKTNFAIFYIDITDKQVTEVDDRPGLVIDTLKIKNAAEAHSLGAELEIQAKLTDYLDFFAGYGYSKAVFDNWVASEIDKKTGRVTYYDYEDKELPNAPEHTCSAGLQYRSRAGIFARTDILRTGDFYSDAKNGLKVDGHTLVNLKIGYESEFYDLVFWGENIFDEGYETIKFDRRNDFCIDGDPRVFGVKLTLRF